MVKAVGEIDEGVSVGAAHDPTKNDWLIIGSDR
jgi:hypothetical protein